MKITNTRTDSWAWRGWCLALVLPTAAVLHHLVFYRSSCMLNPFGPEYDLPIVKDWLMRDPSLPVGVVLAALSYVAGRTRFAVIVRCLVMAVVIGFIPLTLWLWDIPGSGRWICRHFHDDHWVLPVIGPARTKHIYVLCVVLTAVVLGLVWRKQRRGQGSPAAA